MTTISEDDLLTTDLYDQPGHLVRRAQQIAVSMFHAVIGTHVTPVQYAVLRILQGHPNIDQNTLASLCALDTSTTAALVARLEERGLLERSVNPKNRKFRLVRLTELGADLLHDLVPAVHELRRQMLASFAPDEQDQFMTLLKKFVKLNNEQSRAPFRGRAALE
ncbi:MULTISPECIES: MarR family transcriptional regulator [Burkholderiaceae]|uniref:MarR family winged helix-turn-helix transcriptional regulator n=1 Tax=Burkholderiaceae TaxID=119060 RepID=UPI0014210EF2|nr:MULTISPECIES: MarR family transcriptional regulator [Burkholderiaceae]MBN3851133.1 MarR family transcriptional regulator [Paraburkholderia sp. Ac-20342]NIF51253.1 MarR family transcriptional regulator [Burkholderia sp. Ax-1724]